MTTRIEWTERTFNCVAGCTPVSPGCANCYAATMTRRLEKMGNADYAGLTDANRRFTGEVRLLHHRVSLPLSWRKPRMVFVNSMADLFHDDVPFEFIDRVLAVMALCPQHTFQVLTKRPGRMADYLTGLSTQYGRCRLAFDPFLKDGDTESAVRAMRRFRSIAWRDTDGPTPLVGNGPLPNLWLGVSAEDQERLDERLRYLLQCPAAVRFLSLEPLLAPIPRLPLAGINWVIVGGESGPGARSCDIGWIRNIVAQCKAANVRCFTKQLGARPIENGKPLILKDPKGGDPSEWPPDLRVREWPTSKGEDR